MTAIARARVLLAPVAMAGRVGYWLLFSACFLVRYLVTMRRGDAMADRPVRRILVICSTDKLGDAILRGAFIKLVRLKFPDAEISVATNDHVGSKFAALYREHGDADRLLQYPLRLYSNPVALMRFLRGIAAGRFDLLVLVPYFTYDRLADWFLLALFRLAGIRQRIGYRVDDVRGPYFLTTPVALNPLAQNWYDMVQAYARALELDTALLSHRLVPFVYPGDNGQSRVGAPRIGIHVAGDATINRRWPLENFALVCSSLCQKGYQVVLLGDTSDARENTSIMQSVLHSKPDADIVNLAGSSLSESIAALNQCDVFIGNDSGPMHLAAALGVPAVAIFGPSDLRLYRPDRLDSRHTVIAASCPDRQDRLVLFRDASGECGCGLSYDPAAPDYPHCLRQITPRLVLDAVNDKL